MKYTEFLDNLNNKLNEFGDKLSDKLNTSLDASSSKINTALTEATDQFDSSMEKIDPFNYNKPISPEMTYTIPDSTPQAPGVYLSNGEQITGLSPVKTLEHPQPSIEDLISPTKAPKTSPVILTKQPQATNPFEQSESTKEELHKPQTNQITPQEANPFEQPTLNEPIVIQPTTEEQPLEVSNTLKLKKVDLSKK